MTSSKTQQPVEAPAKGRAPLLADRIAVITGAGSGIGRATARLFAAEGANVVLTDLDQTVVEATSGELQRPGDHLALPMDVSDPGAVTDGFAAIKERYGRLDVAFLCAGTWRPHDDGPLERVTLETWDKLVAVNMTGVFLTAQAALALIPDDAGGSIVTVASVAALTGWDKLYAYSASKGGVVSFTRVLAVEGARRGVRANCICPGAVQTPLTNDVLAHSTPVVPLGRIGQPEDIAQAALYLGCSMSQFLTGAVIPVDGGFSAV